MSVFEEADPVVLGTCWCCDQEYAEQSLVRLGSRPEVAVCLRCAHDLHHRAAAREDEGRRSGAARARAVLRSGRRFVTDHDLHQKPVIGPVFRWLGRFMP